MDFFEENKRFSELIQHYARVLNDREIEDELWVFLWLLLQKHTPKDDRYITRSLKNKFIDLYRKKRRNSAFELSAVDNSAEFKTDIEFYDLLKILTDREKNTLVLQFVYGYSLTECAEFFNTSRQNTSQIQKRALNKLRNYVIEQGIY